MNDPKYIILHHSTTKDGRTYDTDAIRNYHVNVLKWNDIGYHFLLERVNYELEIIPGRPIHKEGAHALGFNDRSVGICLIGNYDKDFPPYKMILMAVDLMKSIKIAFNISTANIIGHKGTYPLLHKPVEKTCPGNNIDMHYIREAVGY